jgi:hypothetical protein
LGSLDDQLQRGARQVIQQTVEAELATLLEQYDNVSISGGECVALRDGYHPQRNVVTPARCGSRKRMAILNGDEESQHSPVEMVLELK